MDVRQVQHGPCEVDGGSPEPPSPCVELPEGNAAACRTEGEKSRCFPAQAQPTCEPGQEWSALPGRSVVIQENQETRAVPSGGT